MTEQGAVPGTATAGTATAPPDATTPVRALGRRDDDGFVLLRETDVRYRDGAEDEVLALVRATDDRRSTSEDMVSRATGWAQRYHSDPARANVLRALDLPADARVLEIGAGSGAVTRYLGETCALVDAIEPMPARAAAAAARTADQDGVEIFVGEIGDVPATPAYDAIIVIGVLEYVGRGTADPAPYRQFLGDIAARLVDGGSLVLAIENQLGVKYLVGAPEDHTRGLFDSIENYPRGGHARTFSRARLEAMVRGAGLEPRTLGAFPDYKLTRAVLGEFPAGAESLAYRIPRFPSPDWMGTRPRLADERTVWQTLVDAGLGADFPNSFVVVAGKGGRSPLWPDKRCGVFYSIARRPELVAETVVERVEDGDGGGGASDGGGDAAGDSAGDGDGGGGAAVDARADASPVVFRRRALVGGDRAEGSEAGAGGAEGSEVDGTGAEGSEVDGTETERSEPVGPGPIRLAVGTREFQPGVDLPRVIADVGLAGAEPYLRQWWELLDATLADSAADGRAFDVVPHNLVLTPDGTLKPIDDELRAPGVGREQIIRRGLYHLAKEATALTPAARWKPHSTIGDVMIAFGSLLEPVAELDADGAWVRNFLDEEAALQATVRDRRPHGASDAEWVEQVRRGIAATVDTKLSALPFGDRLPAAHARARKRIGELREQVLSTRMEAKAARAEVKSLTAQLSDARKELARERGAAAKARRDAKTARATLPRARARRAVGRLLPRGTRRRDVAERGRRVWRDARRRVRRRR